MSQQGTHDWLQYYLRDHLAGARAGVNMFARLARSHSHQQARTELAAIHAEVEEEYRVLQAIMADLGMRPVSVTMLMSVVGELAERLKPSGSLVKRTMGADVLELEALIAAVQAKARLWETLLVLSDTDPSLDAEQLRRLRDQAEAQRISIIKLHSQVIRSSRHEPDAS